MATWNQRRTAPPAGEGVTGAGQQRPQPLPNRHLLAFFTDTAAALTVPKILVLQPYGRPVPNREPLLESFRAHFEPRGWLVWDMSEALPREMFVHGAAHLNERG